jgi:3-oxoacyl-[acyl-carrier protein] reductase
VKEKRPGVSLTNPESIDRHFAVSARASALMMREYLVRHIRRKARWGRKTSLTTTSAHARLVGYAASKHAPVSFNLSAAQEMGKCGITVNIVFPGATQTGYVSPELEEQLAAKTPLGRVGQPQDTADVIVLLASEQAHWIRGQLVCASGGFPG